MLQVRTRDSKVTLKGPHPIQAWDCLGEELRDFLGGQAGV